MTTDLSRRSFGILTLGLTATMLPRMGIAQAVLQYATPGLLVEPGALMGAMPPSTGGEAAFADAGMAVIDVRPPDAYAAGHIPGAVHLDPNAVATPHSPIDGTLRPVPEIEALLGGLGVGPNTAVVFYDDRGGFHAARMVWLMEYLGHRNVALLNGGWAAWVAFEGASISTRTAMAEGLTFQSAISPRRHATADDVLAHRDDPGTVLIDVRPPRMFSAGHIPWAINIPWSQNLDEDGRFRPAADLMAHFERHGVTPERNVIMHCQVGLASSHSYVALRLLGFPRVRVYHRSWAEWGSDPALPKVTA